MGAGAAMGATTTPRFGEGSPQMVQYLPPLLAWVHPTHSQSIEEVEDGMMGAIMRGTCTKDMSQ
jgi:hypothetical protein